MTLVAGQRFMMSGSTWRVLHVNESRAHCKCEAVQQVTFKDFDKKTGEERSHTFVARSGQTIDISPNSTVEMVDDPSEPATMIRVLPAEPARSQPVPTVGAGWHRTDVQMVVKPGSRLEAVLVYLTAYPGSTSAQLVEAIGKGADQIVQDLKRKGLVEKR